MAIEAHGGIGVYERDGQYQLYVDAVRLTGEGALYQEFLRLKARLEAEGLFDPERKRSRCRNSGKTGDCHLRHRPALQDILNTLRRRYPMAGSDPRALCRCRVMKHRRQILRSLQP
jgi:exodeoxyribonuclease VII large subunit